MSGLITCPECEGRKRLFALVDGPKYSGPAHVACAFCKGAGEVDPIRAEWLRQGREHYAWRVHVRRESARDCAARLGITAPELCHMEHGRHDPAPIMGEVPEGARGQMRAVARLDALANLLGKPADAPEVQP